MITTLTGYLKLKKEPRSALLKSVPVRPGAPRKGLTLLYGYVQPPQVIGHLKREAREQGYHIENVKVMVDIGEFDAGRRSVGDLPDMRVLDLNWTRRDLRDYISEYLIEWQKKARIKPLLRLPAKAIQRHPRLLDKLINVPAFAHMRYIVWTAESIHGLPDIAVATLFKTEFVTGVRPRTIDMPVTLNL